jgi:hypothetical protein
METRDKHRTPTHMGTVFAGTGTGTKKNTPMGYPCHTLGLIGDAIFIAENGCIIPLLRYIVQRSASGHAGHMVLCSILGETLG